MNHYQTFTERFAGLLTFQLFPEKSNGRPYHFTKSSELAASELHKRNKAGMGAFMMINEGNGMGRKAEHVKTVRAVFADLDHVSLQQAYDQLSKNHQGGLNLHPHMIVNTSQNKHHLYWFVDNFPIDRFKQVQKAIAQKIGSDSAVCDLGRVMRVPGFFPQKDEPYPVKITNLIDTGNYSYEQIIQEFPLPEAKPKPVFRQKIRQKVTGGVDFRKLDVVSWFHSHGLYQKTTNETGKHWVTCPWAHEHTDGIANPTDTIIYEPNPLAGFHCSHAHCHGRNLHQVAALLGDAKDFVR